MYIVDINGRIFYTCSREEHISVFINKVLQLSNFHSGCVHTLRLIDKVKGQVSAINRDGAFLDVTAKRCHLTIAKAKGGLKDGASRPAQAAGEKEEREDA